ncbi:MAG: hypothetical protein H6R17_1563 [Proteobacteria bacterium]|nr:hypothetical protein [Pseudomonadota bacterium]
MRNVPKEIFLCSCLFFLHGTALAALGENEASIVADQAHMLSSGNIAFNDPAAPAIGIRYFDWGLPFFFGRRVFTAIEGRSTPGGNGPYVAY